MIPNQNQSYVHSPPTGQRRIYSLPCLICQPDQRPSEFLFTASEHSVNGGKHSANATSVLMYLVLDGAENI